VKTRRSLSKFTEKQIAALRYLIFRAKNGTDLSKRVLAFLIASSEGLTKDVCLTLIENREGYSADEIHEAGRGVGGLQSSCGTTFIDQILIAMGSTLAVSVHYGDFDPSRPSNPFNTDGQFAGWPKDKLSQPESGRTGMPLRYTFWLSKRPYSRQASLVVATREALEKINLKKPGLYTDLERD